VQAGLSEDGGSGQKQMRVAMIFPKKTRSPLIRVFANPKEDIITARITDIAINPSRVHSHQAQDESDFWLPDWRGHGSSMMDDAFVGCRCQSVWSQPESRGIADQQQCIRSWSTIKRTSSGTMINPTACTATRCTWY